MKIREEFPIDDVKTRDSLREIARSMNSQILPIGIILMYDGTGIADVDTRTEDIGSRTGDTISMPGWKVCNGNGSTPDLRYKFIRGDIASGNTGGSDDAIVVSHTHGSGYTGYTQPNHKHLAPDQSNTGINEQWGYGGRYGNKEYDYNAPEGSERNSKTNSTGGNHRHTIASAGSDGTGANKPAYYSLIFIKKVA